MAEREFKFDIPEWLRDLLLTAQATGRAMFEAEEARRDPDLYDQADLEEQEFKRQLRRLYFWYEPKFQAVNGVTVNIELDGPEDVYSLDFDEARQLFQDIRDLMEELGHTRFSTEKHVEEGVPMPE